MKQNVTNLVPKSSDKYQCLNCDYTTSRKSQYMRHILTDKHHRNQNETFVTDLVPKSSENVNVHQCFCGIRFNNRTTLWRHKKVCKNQTAIETDNVGQPIDRLHFITPELVMELIQDNKEMKNIILEQTNTINNLIKNGITQTNYNTNSLNNNNNKTFNLQFFLNETCKDAMNIMDFVDSIKLQLSDLEKIGEIGYAQGISNIITSNLKALDITQRPVHCTDKKRETMYIKDENKWEKEDDNNTKLRKVIKRIANKNITLLPQFREKYPEYSDSSSKISDKYDHIVVEAMGGMGNNDLDKENKIIHNISKCVTIPH